MSDQDSSLRDSLPPGLRRELYDQFIAAMKAAPRFVRDPIEAVESIAKDPTATWAARVLAKVKLEAWGNYSPYAIHDDGSPMTQEDIAAALGTDKQRVSDAVLYQAMRGRMRPKAEVGKLMWPAIVPKAAPKPDENIKVYSSKSGRYRTFLEVWRLANSSEYAEFEAAQTTVKRIQTKILSEFRSANRKSGRCGLSTDESGDVINSGPDVADKKSLTSRTVSLLKIPSDPEDSQGFSSPEVLSIESPSSSSSSSEPTTTTTASPIKSNPPEDPHPLPTTVWEAARELTESRSFTREHVAKFWHLCRRIAGERRPLQPLIAEDVVKIMRRTAQAAGGRVKQFAYFITAAADQVQAFLDHGAEEPALASAAGASEFDRIWAELEKE